MHTDITTTTSTTTKNTKTNQNSILNRMVIIIFGSLGLFVGTVLITVCLWIWKHKHEKKIDENPYYGDDGEDYIQTQVVDEDDYYYDE